MSARRLSLRANFSWVLVGNLVYAGCQAGMMVYLAQTRPVADVGRFTLGMAIAAPLFIFTNLSLRNAQVSDARDEYSFGEYLGLRLTMTTVAVITLSALMLGLSYGAETAFVVIGVGAYKAFESFSDIHYGFLQKHERMDRVAHSMTARGVLALLGLIVGCALTDSLIWGTIGMTVGGAVVFLIADIRNVYRTHTELELDEPLAPHWNVGDQFRLGRLTLPLGIAILFGSLTYNIPRYVIEAQLSEHELGIFGALAYLLVAGDLVFRSLAQTVGPRLAKSHVATDSLAFLKYIGILLVISVVLGLSGLALNWIAGEWILTVLYDEIYAEHTDVLGWLIFSFLVASTSSSFTQGMVAGRMFKPMSVIYAASAAMALGSSLYFVPRAGIVGGAWSVAAGNGVQFVLCGACVAWIVRGQRRRRQRVATETGDDDGADAQ